MALCLSSMPCSQCPKEAPPRAYAGYAHSDDLLKKGRISIPTCQKRTARPALHPDVSELLPCCALYCTV
ncbi:uncharacterized protein MAM_02209 [Metarhizium album ARSEF 1941]|uniref:Uncharacterized protein n=1 Tax=Metarhizium album (strain ARSEF 1941) TaxID=1081103 RepID=A0A0B2X4S9_METAS|nr:uncharacterized protein MAM_02209 [Metarhizium album ARSEF 1941]KHO00286.1 hypothetical protein MAM_02209 [Metarhizium album ARSEF 1941]